MDGLCLLAGTFGDAGSLIGGFVLSDLLARLPRSVGMFYNSCMRVLKICRILKNFFPQWSTWIHFLRIK